MVFVFILAGIALVVLSGLLWTKQPTTFDRASGTQDGTQFWRLVILVAWTILLPAYSLWEWHTQPQPTGTDLAAFQYGHKVLGDFWTAVAVVLGLIFGIKK